MGTESKFSLIVSSSPIWSVSSGLPVLLQYRFTPQIYFSILDLFLKCFIRRIESLNSWPRGELPVYTRWDISLFKQPVHGTGHTVLCSVVGLKFFSACSHFHSQAALDSWSYPCLLCWGNYVTQINTMALYLTPCSNCSQASDNAARQTLAVFTKSTAI